MGKKQLEREIESIKKKIEEGDDSRDWECELNELQGWFGIREYYTHAEESEYILNNKEKIEELFGEFLEQGYDGVRHDGLSLARRLLRLLGYPNGAEVLSFISEALPG